MTTYVQGPEPVVYPGSASVYNLGHILERNASLSGVGSAVAVIEHGRTDERHRSTYGELNARANRFGQALAALGTSKGDRVFVLLPNRVETLEVLFGCLKVGAIFTPANFRLSVEELSFMIEDVQPRLLVFDSDYAERVWELAQLHPQLQLVEVGKTEVSKAKPYDELLRRGAARPPAVPTGPEETAFILFTAGSTGRPKGVRLTHRGVFFACLANGLSAHLTRNDVYCGAPPMFHAGGLTCFQLYMLMLNGTIVLVSRWTPEGTLQVIKAYGVTFHFGIATQLKMLTQVEGWHKYVGSLRAVNGGGEPQPAELKEAFVRRGITYFGGYGLTETGATGLNWGASSLDDPILKKASECMGKSPAFVEVKVVDERGQEVGPAEIGEIVVRREPTGAAGYWNRPDEEAKKFRSSWVFTGDLGKYDEDGFFYVLGRTDDMIISGGENIYPAEIERVIYSHPRVADAVVVRAKHPQWGQTPKAVIVPKRGETLTEEEVLDYVSSRLAPFKKPRKVVFVEDLPRSETGKIDKKKVRELYEER